MNASIRSLIGRYPDGINLPGGVFLNGKTPEWTIYDNEDYYTFM